MKVSDISFQSFHSEYELCFLKGKIMVGKQTKLHKLS